MKSSFKGLVIALCGLVLMTACKKDVAVSSISVNPTTLNLKVGESSTITADVQPGDATNRNVVWSTSDAKVATVDATGKVTAVKNGSATITATTEDGAKSATCAVTVGVPVTGVKLNTGSLEMSVGDTVTMKATITPADATNKKVSWRSGDSTIVKVDANGKVTAVKAGKAVIAVTTEDGGKTDMCNVSVSESAPVYPETGTKAIKINGLWWAPVNCGYDSTSADFKYGHLYQWGRKYGQGYKGALKNPADSVQLSVALTVHPDITDTNSTKFYWGGSFGNYWYDGVGKDSLWNSGRGAYDPCPSGWRVPTYDELCTLMGGATEETTGSGWDGTNKGYWFNGTKSPKVAEGLFLPAAGYRKYNDAAPEWRGRDGCYWSSSIDSDKAKSLNFGDEAVIAGNEQRKSGQSVRCVYDSK